MTLTNQTEPNKLKLDDSDYSQRNPTDGLGIHTQPKESLIRRVDLPSLWFGALKDPVRIAGLRVDFVPPPEAY